MFLLKKNKKLKIKNQTELKNDKNLTYIYGGFVDKKGIYFSKEMFSIKEIKLQNDIIIGNNRPFYFDGWWWYPWMFQNIYANQLKIE